MKTRLPLAALSGFVLTMAGTRAAETADAIYHNGPIVTVNDAAPSAEALAVKEGKILAVGKKDDVLKTRGDSTKLVDLGGKTLTPGFIDGHAHFFQFGTQAVGANLLAPAVETTNPLEGLCEIRRADGTRTRAPRRDRPLF